VGQGHGSNWTPNSGDNPSPRSTQGIAGFQRPLTPATTIVGNYMPYTDATDPNLPDYVKALPDLKKRQWIAVWNSSYKRCRDKGGDDCESSAFAQANGVVIKRARGKGFEELFNYFYDNPNEAKKLLASMGRNKDLDDIAKTMPWRLVEHQLTQLQASYKPTGGTQLQSCANCQFFVTPDACLVVSGDISPTGISDEWRQRADAPLLDNAPGEHEDPAAYNRILDSAAELGESHTTGANTTKSTAKKLTQEAAEYDATGGSDVRSCSNCFWFEAPAGCRVVSGTIAPNGLSQLWTAPGVNAESEADDMVSGAEGNKAFGLDESTMGLLLDWAQENPDQVEFMLDNLGKEKSLDPINQFHNREDRPMNSGPTGILEGIDIKGIGSSNFLKPDNECQCAACTAVDDSAVEASKELGGLSWALTKAKLTTSARDALPTSSFGYIDPKGGKHFPVHDAVHARLAVQMLSKSPYGPKAKSKVCAAAKRFGIDAAACGGSKSFKSFVKGLFNGDCVGCKEDGLFNRDEGLGVGLGSSALFKDGMGRLRVYFRASNNFKDRHHEIITEAAHKDYEHFVDKYEQYPEFWLWHTKGTRWGKADVVTYADGFLHVFGVVDPGCEDIARNVIKQRSAVSHGFLTFNQQDNIISKYRSWEISPLPRGAEANQWFTEVGFVDLRKEVDMPIPEAKKAWMQELGVPADMIKAIEQESLSMKGLLDGLDVESKAVDKPKAEAGVAGQAKRKRPDQLHTAVGQDDNDNDTEPDNDEDDKPTRSGPDKKELKRQEKLALFAAIKSLNDRLGSIEEKLNAGVKQAAPPDQGSDEEIYLGSLQRAAKSFAPTRKDAGNELDPKVAGELEEILGRPVTPGKEETPNSWFGSIIGAVERMGG
jgi:Zn-finger protein